MSVYSANIPKLLRSEIQTAHNTLSAARDMLAQPGGWHQGDFFPGAAACRPGVFHERLQEATCLCAVGAIRKASLTLSDFPFVAPMMLATALAELGWPPEEWSTPDWNDHPDRTQDQVVQAFDHAIKLCTDELARRDAELAALAARCER